MKDSSERGSDVRSNAVPRILIAGGGGFIGTALRDWWRQENVDTVRLVRREPAAPNEVRWDPAVGALDDAAVGPVDAVVNLAGENIGAGRWTAERREKILRSRVDATRTLVAAVGRWERKPQVFLSASASGYYGERGDTVLTEESSIGHGFLPEVCLAWETHAEGARRHGVRVALLRFGVVLGVGGGVLARLRPIFRLGLGGPLGSGQQWMSWVSLTDAVRAIAHARVTRACEGPVNVVAPLPVRNAEFSASLARHLRRPAGLRAPVWALRFMLGRMADETALASARIRPGVLEGSGFVFRQSSLEAAMEGIR